MGRFGRSSSAPPAETPGGIDASQLVDAIGARVHVDVTIPRTTIRGRMRLVSRREMSTIKSETREYLKSEGFPVDATAVTALGAFDEYQYELGVRTLQVAVRDPRREQLALGKIEDWRELDDDQIAAVYERYKDLAARLDPLGSNVELSAGEVASLIDAAKKKDGDLLTSFGSRKLASFTISLVSQQSTSPTPKS
jgi:hypothetical protein